MSAAPARRRARWGLTGLGLAVLLAGLLLAGAVVLGREYIADGAPDELAHNAAHAAYGDMLGDLALWGVAVATLGALAASGAAGIAGVQRLRARRPTRRRARRPAAPARPYEHVLDRRAPLPTLGELVASDRRLIAFDPAALFIQDTAPGGRSCARDHGRADSPIVELDRWARRIDGRRELLDLARRCGRARGCR